MAEEQEPFADVVDVPGGFSIPELKWRELLFVGALRPDGAFFVRDPSRPLPPFRREGLFPEGVRFRVEAASANGRHERASRRVAIRRADVPGTL